MTNLLLKKLLIKPGHTLRLIDAPRNAAAILGAFPADVTVTESAGEGFDAALLFATDAVAMTAAVAKVAERLQADIPFWVIYPKKASGIPSDLDRMDIWQSLEKYGIGPVASASIDEAWTALRLRPLAASKPSGLCNDDIPDSPYAEFIDVGARTITAPPDLAQALCLHPSARAFFDGLSFTNKKEYVLWLLTAKQDKTRQERLAKSVEKLLAGKKNPSEK